MTQLKFETWPIERLTEYARNPRKNDHAVDKIAGAIKEFGFRIPVVAKSDGLVVDGHLRLKAAKKLGLTEVPVILADDMTDAQIKAFRISVNRMAEFAEWDNDLLALEFDELTELGFDLDLTGFTAEEIAALMPVELEPGLTDPDDAPALQETAITVVGDVWIMGKHRLLCGDSTSIDAVDKLMDGQKADMVFTDPPYGMFLDTDYSKIIGSSKAKIKGGGKSYSKVIGDHNDFTPELVQTVFSAFPDVEEIFMWGGDYYAELLPNKNDGSWIVWDKRGSEEADKIVGSAFELCWSKQKHKRDIARIKWMGAFGYADARQRVHPTQKPIALAEWFFERWGKPSDRVADLFGGSGSTLIACEKTNRSANLMELDPKYCDVIVKRWQDFTGKIATHAETGQPFAEVTNGNET